MIELDNLGYEQDMPRTPTWTNDNIGESFSSVAQHLLSHKNEEKPGEELVCKIPVQEESKNKKMRKNKIQRHKKKESFEGSYEKLYNNFELEEGVLNFERIQKIDVLYKSALRMIKKFYLRLFHKENKKLVNRRL